MTRPGRYRARRSGAQRPGADRGPAGRRRAGRRPDGQGEPVAASGQLRELTPGDGLWLALKASVRTAPALTLGTAACALLLAVEPAVFVVVTARLIGSLPAAIEAGGTGPMADRVFRLLTVAAALFLVGRVLPTLQDTLAGRLGRRMNAELTRRVMVACQAPVHLDHFDDPDVQAAISLVRDDTTGFGMPGTAISGFFAVIGPKLSGLGGVVVLAGYSLLYAGVGLAVFALLLVGTLRALILLAGTDVAARASFLPAEYLRTTALDVKPARELRVFGLSGWIRGRVGAQYLQAMRALWGRRDRFIFGLAIALLLSVGGLSALLYGRLAALSVDGQLSLTTFLTVFQATALLVSVSISGQDLQAMHGAAAMKAILQLEQRAAASRAATHRPQAVALPPAAPQVDLRCEGLTLRHRGSDRDVLDRLDLTIPAGQRLAVVGRNGAGKTTLATVLSGLRPPTAGRLLVDGVDLAVVDVSTWQRRVAVLSQNFVRYPLTVRDNVGLGAPELIEDRAAVERAAELAGAGPVIAGIDGGWDAVLSPTLKGGTDLSGGQWQRIGLARALFAVSAGARVLILDEPTSALDVRAEAALFSELIAMPALAGVTVILISHRFSSVRQAERIVVLEDGAVIEDGDHAALVAAGGRYAELFAFQAALFHDGDPDLVGDDPDGDLRDLAVHGA